MKWKRDEWVCGKESVNNNSEINESSNFATRFVICYLTSWLSANITRMTKAWDYWGKNSKAFHSSLLILQRRVHKLSFQGKTLAVFLSGSGIAREEIWSFVCTFNYWMLSFLDRISKFPSHDFQFGISRCNWQLGKCHWSGIHSLHLNKTRSSELPACSRRNIQLKAANADLTRLRVLFLFAFPALKIRNELVSLVEEVYKYFGICRLLDSMRFNCIQQTLFADDEENFHILIVSSSSQVPKMTTEDEVSPRKTDDLSVSFCCYSLCCVFKLETEHLVYLPFRP